VVKRAIFVTVGLIFALLMTLFPVSMIVGSSGSSVGTGFEPYYSLAFHVYNETTLDPIEGALVEILFTNFTVAASNLTDHFGNVSFMLLGGSYMYNVTAIGYLETLSDEFLLGSDTTFQVGLWTSILLPIFITTPMSGENFVWENQTLAGNITDPNIVHVMYNVTSALGDEFGFVPVVNGSFTANITLMEGYNVLTATGLNSTGHPVADDMVIVRLDTWRPFTCLLLNYLKDIPKMCEIDFLNGTGNKMGDNHVKPTLEKGRVEKVEIDYTDKDGNKISDLHIYYTRDPKNPEIITKIVITITNPLGEVIGDPIVWEGPDLPEITIDDETGKVKAYKCNLNNAQGQKIGDVDAQIGYEGVPPRPKTAIVRYTDEFGNERRKITIVFDYKTKLVKGGVKAFLTGVIKQEYVSERKNERQIGEVHEKYDYDKADKLITRKIQPFHLDKGNFVFDPKKDVWKETSYEYTKEGKFKTTYQVVGGEKTQLGPREKLKDPENVLNIVRTFFDPLNNTLAMINETYTNEVFTYEPDSLTLIGQVVFSDVSDDLVPPLPSLSIVQVTVSGETDNRTEVFLTYDDYVNITSMLYPGSNTVTIMVMDEAGNIMMNSHILIAVPSIESSNIEGNRKDVYVEGESVHVYGSNLVSNAIYPIYVVQDVAWTEGMSIPARLPGTPTTVATNSTGQIPPTKIWTSSVAGKYDIIIDVNDDGFYNATIDALDNNDIDGAGFIVTKIPHSPIANFTESSETPRVYETVYFDASTSKPGFDGDDECPIIEYRWDFGDGTSGPGKTVRHIYEKPGNYTVTLTVHAPGIPPYIDPQYGGTNTTDTIQHVKQVIPVGGYTIPIDTYTTATPPTTYFAILTIIVAVFTAIRRKTHRKTR